MGGRLEYESVGAAAGLLAGYDRESGKWAFPRIDEFWEAVAEAHRRGFTGQGKRAAIVDSGFDLSIPKLAAACDGEVKMWAGYGKSTDHGTAVALLILTVAPDAKLDLYEVDADGAPDLFAARRAIRMAAETQIDALCLSLGVPIAREEVHLQPIDDLVEPSFTDQIDAMFEAGGHLRAKLACPADPCLCQEMKPINEAGCMILAAAGNDKGSFYCPALSQHVASIGFQRVARHAIGQREAAIGLSPDFSQSAFTDYQIMQPDDVLGSSFATPLAAGSVLLGNELGVAQSMTLSAYADALLGLSHAAPLHQDLVARMMALYEQAINQLPHLHALMLEDDHWCMGCAQYVSRLFTNAGLACMVHGDLNMAERLLRIARRLAPASPHAAANLARTLVTRVERHENNAVALCREALSLYDVAMARRPDYRGYDETRARVVAFLSHFHDPGVT